MKSFNASCGWVLGVSLLLMPSMVSWGAEPDAAQLQRNADASRECQRMAQSIQGELAQIQGDSQMFQGVANEDVVKAKVVFDAASDAFQKAAQAWDRGDVKQGDALRDQANRLGGSRDIWRTRIMDVRRRQAEVTPTEWGFAKEMTWTVEKAYPEYCARIEAARSLADALGVEAEAMVPGADPAHLAELSDKVQVAMAEAEIAEWRLRWARDVIGMLASRQGMTEQDVKKELERVRAVQEQRADLRRQQVESERKARQVDADLRKAGEDLGVAFMAAATAKEKAAVEKAAQERAAEEKAAQDKAAQERAAQEKAAQDKAAQQKAAQGK